MNYLELCQQVVLDGAIIGGHEAKPDTVLNQQGRLRLVVDWVARSNREIMVRWNDWSFRSREVDTIVLANSEKIALTDVDRINENGVYVRDDTGQRSKIHALDWTHFRDLRSTQVIPTATALPDKFAVSPSGEMHFYPVCSRQFIVRFEAVMSPQILSADADISWIPPGYHDAIVYRALMYFYGYDEADVRYNEAEQNFLLWLGKLEGACLPFHDMHDTSKLETPLQMHTQ